LVGDLVGVSGDLVGGLVGDLVGVSGDFVGELGDLPLVACADSGDFWERATLLSERPRVTMIADGFQ